MALVNVTSESTATVCVRLLSVMFTRLPSLGVFTGFLVSDSGFSWSGLLWLVVVCATRGFHLQAQGRSLSSKADGLGKAPLLCLDVLAWNGVTEREDQASSVLACRVRLFPAPRVCRFSLWPCPRRPWPWRHLRSCPRPQPWSQSAATLAALLAAVCVDGVRFFAVDSEQVRCCAGMVSEHPEVVLECRSSGFFAAILAASLMLERKKF